MIIPKQIRRPEVWLIVCVAAALAGLMRWPLGRAAAKEDLAVTPLSGAQAAPAQAGVQARDVDARFRGDDETPIKSATFGRLAGAALAQGLGKAVNSAPPLSPTVSLSPTAPLSLTQPFADWHLPVPAGKWGISRGPCNSGAPFAHDCTYYEERCAVDLVALSGSMENVPVLAPQAGEVFFEGVRTDGGLTLVVRHDDGRASVFMHLSRVVVGADEHVEQGQVLGYVGRTGSIINPHLHFVVQPSVVQRECVDLKGLDQLHFAEGWAISQNLSWRDLALPEPPAVLPSWLPTLAISPALSGGEVLLPTRLWLTPTQAITLPVVAASDVDELTVNGFGLKPAARQPAGVLFNLGISAPAKPGTYTQTLQALIGLRVAGPWVPMSYTVRAALDLSVPQGVILFNPAMLSPANWARVRGAPKLCWHEYASAGREPFHFRVMAVGPASVDSGWITPLSAASPKASPPLAPSASAGGGRGGSASGRNVLASP